MNEFSSSLDSLTGKLVDLKLKMDKLNIITREVTNKASDETTKEDKYISK